MKSKVELRTLLKQLIDEKFGGSITQFAKTINVSQSQVHQWLMSEGKSARNLTESSCVKIERACNTRGWFGFETDLTTPVTDESHVLVPQLDINACAGAGKVMDPIAALHIAVTGELAFKRSWIQGKGLNPDYLRAIKCVGDSMQPYLSDGDTVLVDTSKTNMRVGEVYVFCEDDLVFIKRLSRNADGWILRSDNPDKTRYFDIPMLYSHRVIGAVVWRGG